ncbi:hypothetical protein [Paenibacillus sp. GYB004]|uniref:hypothetical protein n=1 Tax=Paenibacillus sp. GYB004 TaxID=2994393 RepID=UPI003FA6E75F
MSSPERLVQTYEFEGVPAVGLITVTFEELGGGRTKLTETTLYSERNCPFAPTAAELLADCRCLTIELSSPSLGFKGLSQVYSLIRRIPPP